MTPGGSRKPRRPVQGARPLPLSARQRDVLARVLNLLQKASVVLRQAVRPSTVPQQREISERWTAIVPATLRAVGYRRQPDAAGVLRLQL
jgi:hypothetical protein